MTSCYSTQIVLDRDQSRSQVQDNTPSYEDHFDSYVFGRVGKNQVNLQQVCMDQTALKAEYLETSEDIVIGLFTFGIYTPSTVRVWCGD